MNRFRRIASRGWLGKALNILTFGYFPVSDDGVVIVRYVVSANVEIRLVAIIDTIMQLGDITTVSMCLSTSGDVGFADSTLASTEIRLSNFVDVEL